jgi:hypothetical protein
MRDGMIVVHANAEVEALFLDGTHTHTLELVQDHGRTVPRVIRHPDSPFSEMVWVPPTEDIPMTSPSAANVEDERQTSFSWRLVLVGVGFALGVSTAALVERLPILFTALR